MMKKKTIITIKKPSKKETARIKSKVDLKDKIKTGRKEKYNARLFPAIAKRLAFENKNDKEIGDILGITEPTFIKYKKIYPEFFKAIQEGREEPNNEVRQAIVKCAKGYQYEEKVFERVYDNKKKKYVFVKTKTVLKHMPPNPAAQNTWVYSKMKDEFKKTESIDANIKTDYFIKEPEWETKSKKKGE
jgi:hypothetical protein